MSTLKNVLLTVCVFLFGFSLTVFAVDYPDLKVKDIAVGSNPRGIAITPDGEYAYVTCPDGNMIYVIRLSDNAVAGNFSVDNSPWGVTIAPNGEYAYVTCPYDNIVYIIRLSDNAVTGNFSVDISPWGIAITPDGEYAYIICAGSSTISVVRLSDNAVTGNFSVSSSPNGIALTSDEAYAYVTCSSDNLVYITRLSDNIVIDNISIDTLPRGIAITPDGEKVYVANGGSGTVSVIAKSSSPDVYPPSEVSVSITPVDEQGTSATLSWTNPTDSDFAGVKILRKEGSYPASISDGTVVYEGIGTSYVDSLEKGVAYYYTAFTYDEVPNYSDGSQIEFCSAKITTESLPAATVGVYYEFQLETAKVEGGRNMGNIGWNWI